MATKKRKRRKKDNRVGLGEAELTLLLPFCALCVFLWQSLLIAKNYLTGDEVDTLNRLVVIFLEQAELRVKERKDLSLAYWQDNVDKLLAFNDQAVLKAPGRISHDDMKAIAHERYDTFDSNRQAAEAIEADAEDLRQLEQLDQKLKQKKPKEGET